MNLQQTREFMRHATDTALIVVDYQNDFVQYNGALYVPNAELLLPNIAAYAEIARNCSQSRAVFFTADWHPAETLHFNTWPKHCVQNTYSAQIFANLVPDYNLFKKGRSDKDDYSAMNASIFDDGSMPIHQLLEKERITQLVVCGVATEYCVLHTVLDALKRRFHVALAIDAIAGIQVESTQLALTNMFEAGAVPITWSEYLYALTTHVATVSA